MAFSIKCLQVEPHKCAARLCEMEHGIRCGLCQSRECRSARRISIPALSMHTPPSGRCH